MIEEAFFASMAGDVGCEKFKVAVLACLPIAATQLTWAEARIRLETLVASPFARFCGQGLLSQVQTVLLWVKAGEAQRQVKCANVTADFLRQARDACALFLVAPAAGDRAELRGKAAAGSIFAAARTKAATTKVELSDLKDLVIFDWLLTVEQQQRVAGWLDSAVISATVPATRTEPPQQPKRRKMTKASADASEAKVVDDYFGGKTT